MVTGNNSINEDGGYKFLLVLYSLLVYIYYYAEAAITLYTNKLYTHTSRIKPN